MSEKERWELEKRIRELIMPLVVFDCIRYVQDPRRVNKTIEKMSDEEIKTIIRKVQPQTMAWLGGLDTKNVMDIVELIRKNTEQGGV